MQRFYGIHLWRDLEGPDLSWTRLRNLIEQLPLGAATWRSMHGEAAQWGPTEHLLASLVDQGALRLWQEGGGKLGKKPKPIPRPGEKPKSTGDTSRVSPEKVREVLDRLKGK